MQFIRSLEISQRLQMKGRQTAVRVATRRGPRLRRGADPRAWADLGPEEADAVNDDMNVLVVPVGVEREDGLMLL